MDMPGLPRGGVFHVLLLNFLPVLLNYLLGYSQLDKSVYFPPDNLLALMLGTVLPHT